MGKLRKAWSWIKKYWIIIVGALASAIVGLLYLAYKNDERIPQIRFKEQRVNETKERIAFLEGKKETLIEQEGDFTADIDRIDNELKRLESEKKTYEADLKKMTMREKLDEFKRHGI